jgi:hypothetical protein
MKIDESKIIKTEPRMIKHGIGMDISFVPLILLFVLSIIVSSCTGTDPLLTRDEYTVTDTLDVSKNGFGQVLGYDVIIFNHYDSVHHYGWLTSTGKLVELNPRPIKK